MNKLLLNTTVATTPPSRALVPIKAASSIKYPVRCSKFVHENHGFKRLSPDPVQPQEDHVFIYTCQKGIIARPALDLGSIIDIFA